MTTATDILTQHARAQFEPRCPLIVGAAHRETAGRLRKSAPVTTGKVAGFTVGTRTLVNAKQSVKTPYDSQGELARASGEEQADATKAGAVGRGERPPSSAGATRSITVTNP